MRGLFPDSMAVLVCSIMLNILGEGSGPQGKRKAEELMSRAMQASASCRPNPAGCCSSLLCFVCLSRFLSVSVPGHPIKVHRLVQTIASTLCAV